MALGTGQENSGITRIIWIFFPPFLIVAIISGVGALVIDSRSAQPAESIRTMLTAAWPCPTAAIVAMIPLLAALRSKTDRIIPACMAALGVRLLLTTILSATIYYLVIDKSQSTAFVLWLTGYYVSLLAWETTVTVICVREYCEVKDGGVNNADSNM